MNWLVPRQKLARLCNQALTSGCLRAAACYSTGMLQILRLVLGTITRLFSTRRSLVLENLALRQQLVVFKRRHCKPRLRLFDKLFWGAARQGWADWEQFLLLLG